MKIDTKEILPSVEEFLELIDYYEANKDSEDIPLFGLLINNSVPESFTRSIDPFKSKRKCNYLFEVVKQIVLEKEITLFTAIQQALFHLFRIDRNVIDSHYYNNRNRTFYTSYCNNTINLSPKNKQLLQQEESNLLSFYYYNRSSGYRSFHLSTLKNILLNPRDVPLTAQSCLNSVPPVFSSVSYVFNERGILVREEKVDPREILAWFLCFSYHILFYKDVSLYSEINIQDAEAFSLFVREREEGLSLLDIHKLYRNSRNEQRLTDPNYKSQKDCYSANNNS